MCDIAEQWQEGVSGLLDRMLSWEEEYVDDALAASTFARFLQQLGRSFQRGRAGAEGGKETAATVLELWLHLCWLQRWMVKGKLRGRRGGGDRTALPLYRPPLLDLGQCLRMETLGAERTERRWQVASARSLLDIAWLYGGGEAVTQQFSLLYDMPSK